MKVTLEEIYEVDELGGKTPQKVVRVFVQHEALKKRNTEGKIHIGWIGTQEGANFMPTSEFYEVLGAANQEQVVAEVKRLHGSANPASHTELPPPTRKVGAGA